jgi:predicted AlkP superfamily phosphohydrolase/phosphomutase
LENVQHYFWQFMDDTHFLHDPAAKSKFGNAIRDVYFRLDATLGKFLEYAGPNTSVFVVSDHDGGPVSDRTIYLNRYLAQIGLLYYRKNTDNLSTFSAGHKRESVTSRSRGEPQSIT